MTPSELTPTFRPTTRWGRRPNHTGNVVCEGYRRYRGYVMVGGKRHVIRAVSEELAWERLHALIERLTGAPPPQIGPEIEIVRQKGEGFVAKMRRLRAEVLERDGRVCRYCGGEADTVDHVIPVAKGGPDTLENLVAACRSCNSRKGKRPLAAQITGEATLEILADHEPVSGVWVDEQCCRCGWAASKSPMTWHEHLAEAVEKAASGEPAER